MVDEKEKTKAKAKPRKKKPTSKAVTKKAAEAKAVAEAPEQEQPIAKDEKEKTTKQGRDIPAGKIFVILGAIVMVAGGLYFGYDYFKTYNTISVALCGFLLFGGGFLIWIFRNKGEGIAVGGGTAAPVFEESGQVSTKAKKGQVNCMNIYDDQRGLRFEDMHEPDGYPWKCMDDNCWYYVNIWNPDTKKLEPLILPDQQYYDPRVFAERVIGLPAHRKIFKRRNNLMSAVKIGALLLAIGIMWIIIMTTTGQPPAGEGVTWYQENQKTLILS